MRNAAGKPSPSRGVRRRRSFSQQNLALETEGALGSLLGEALRTPEAEGYILTHAFHPYPGRFHYLLPRTVLAAIARPGDRVFDPFMGGGTTLVEALQQGLPALGNDLNPVAVLVARERTRLRTPAEARMVTAEAQRIAVQVEALRREKHPPRMEKRFQHRLAAHYQPHLLAELMQWIRLIEAVPDDGRRETLRAVFSSAAVKFSNLAADSQQGVPQSSRMAKTIGKGAASRFLVEKCGELTRAQAALAKRIAPETPPAELYGEDARLLPSLGWGAVDCILTSPPYPGTYDYYAQHRLRMDWLGLDGRALLEGEIGARRDRPAGRGDDSWSAALGETLLTLARVLRPGGALALAMGDWISADHAVDARAALTRIAQRGPWRLESRASVRRAVHSRKEKKAYAKRGKWEHLLLFTRLAAAEGTFQGGRGRAAPPPPHGASTRRP